MRKQDETGKGGSTGHVGLGELLTVSGRQLTWGKMGSMDSSTWHEREATALGLGCRAQGTRRHPGSPWGYAGLSALTPLPLTTSSPSDSRGRSGLDLPFTIPSCVYLQIPSCACSNTCAKTCTSKITAAAAKSLQSCPTRVRLMGDKYSRITRDLGSEHPLRARDLPCLLSVFQAVLHSVYIPFHLRTCEMSAASVMLRTMP